MSARTTKASLQHAIFAIAIAYVLVIKAALMPLGMGLLAQHSPAFQAVLCQTGSVDPAKDDSSGSADHACDQCCAARDQVLLLGPLLLALFVIPRIPRIFRFDLTGLVNFVYLARPNVYAPRGPPVG